MAESESGKFDLIGTGTETSALRRLKGDRQSSSVLKVAEVKSEEAKSPWHFKLDDGRTIQALTITERDMLANLNAQRHQQYGNIIPPLRFIKKEIDNTRYEHLNYAFIPVQKHVEKSEKSDIFEFEPNELPEKAESQLKTLISQLKESYSLSQKSTKNNAPLDLFGKGNLLLDTNNDIKYVDIGRQYGKWVEYPPKIPATETIIFQELIARIAALEFVTQRDPSEFLEEPFYQSFKAYCMKPGHKFSWNDLKDKTKTKDLLLNIREYAAKEPPPPIPTVDLDYI